MSQPAADITRLLRAASSGKRPDLDALLTAIYDDLRRLAASHMQGERRDHTLDATAVVHEAFVRLVDQRNTDWNDRLRFFAIASRIIRRVLIDHARAKQADKRGGDCTRLRIDDHDPGVPPRGVDLIALDEALEELARLDDLQSRVVELRYFAGCSVDETATLLGTSPRSVDRAWKAAKAWLFLRLAGDKGPALGAGADGSAHRAGA
jgi:RNA polymerase sigma factor (TIGR02999 family)